MMTNVSSTDQSHIFDGLREMQLVVHQNAVAHGWHEGKRPVGEYLAIAINNQHRELSELWEAYRNNQLHEMCDKSDMMLKQGIPPLSCLEEEMADVLIRLLDDAQELGVDLAEAVRRKHLYNITRSYRHNGKAC